MADNVAITAGSGTTIASDDIGSVQYQRVKVTWGADGTANDANATTPLPVSGGGIPKTISTSFTRPADTTAYASNDSISDSTTAPTSGGFTITSAARASGGSGIITDVLIASSNAAATPLSGEIMIFDAAVGTHANDNAAVGYTDAEIGQNLVARIPFTLNQSGTTNTSVHLQSLGIIFNTSGSANLRFVVRALAAYTPASAEVFYFRFKVVQID